MKIHLNHLSMTYPTGKQALKDINLTLESPSLIGLVGPNGAGKSTLMKLLVAGLLPTGGDIAIDDKPLTKCEKELKKKLGYLPQDFGLYDELTIWEFLDYMAALKGIRNSRPVIEEVILATGLEEKKKARIKTLSGGQRQRVGIAQALLGEPEFLIFDEPTVGLDPEERIRFRNLLVELSKDRIVIFSTHIIEDISSSCNQVVVINKGELKYFGDPSDMVEMANGKVWQFNIDKTEFEKVLDKSLVIHHIQEGDTIRVRYLSVGQPYEGAVEVEANLEDAYLCLLKNMN